MEGVELLKRLFSEGKVSRREFIAKAAALGATAALSQTFLGTHAFAESDQPRRGGRLRLGTSGGSTTDSIDPADSPPAANGGDQRDQRASDKDTHDQQNNQRDHRRAITA